MLARWLDLLDSVLRPARPHLERCTREADAHVALRRQVAETRARAVADCERRIERARATVFSANDGVVSLNMTELEREWRRLARWNDDDGVIDLWARIAPRSWIDRKRWRDGQRERRVELAVALAADPDGVEGAEAAVSELRAVLAPWGVDVGPRVRWRALDGEEDGVVEELLAAPLAAFREHLATSDASSVVVERAEQLERAVEGAARTRFPAREGLAKAIARAALVDRLWRAAIDLRVTPASRSPAAPLRALWRTGYTLGPVTPASVALLAPISPSS